MICPSLERLYDYLDGGLPGADRAAFEAHVAACPGCRTALAERRAIAQAAVSLPDLDVPDDFVAGVMARLSFDVASETEARENPARRPRFIPVLVGASGLSAAAVVVSLLSGNGLFGLFLALGRSLQSTALSSIEAILKAVKLITHLGRTAGDLLSGVFKGLMVATSFIGPEVQIIVVAAVLAGTLAAGLAFGRKPRPEKDHERI
jgi:hypothetical protein